MGLVLFFIAAAFIWLGIDAFSLGRYASPPTQMEKDEMMFGKAHRPVPEWYRAWAERRYPIATRSSMQIYGCLFIVIGLFFVLMALGALAHAI